MDKEIPHFIVIESQIYLDERLSWPEKALYSYISLLTCNNKGICFASNEHMQSFMKVSKSTLKRYLHNLKKYNYIVISIKKGNKRYINTTLNSYILERYNQSLVTNEDMIDFDWLEEDEVED